jgi:predicted glycosyltransferase involved in capsule biosynthesis
MDNEINCPKHNDMDEDQYKVIDVIESWGLDFHLGNVMNHILQSSNKENNEQLEHLKKSLWFLDRKIQVLEKQNNLNDLNDLNDLRKTTFIIPICIESDDRYNNAKSVLGFLNKHFKTNVIIHELTKDESKLDFLKSLSNLEINHIVEKNSLDYYHRTKQLNVMLNIVKTPVVVNYDIDVMLPIDSYVESQKLVLNDIADFVYPYGDGEYQREISLKYNREKFDVNFDISDIGGEFLEKITSKYGHCIFANTKKYIECGGENEKFVGYGPEDVEREFRIITLKYRISRIDNLVYHFEHLRTPFSSGNNPYFNRNHELCQNIMKMNYEGLLNYYSKVDYKEKYNNFK